MLLAFLIPKFHIIKANSNFICTSSVLECDKCSFSLDKGLLTQFWLFCLFSNMASMDFGTKATRSGGSIMIDLETEYPLIDNFDKHKLPTYKDIVGKIRKLNLKKHMMIVPMM